jgi:hypothetical protein
MRGSPTLIPRSAFPDCCIQPYAEHSRSASQLSKSLGDLRRPVGLGQRTTAFRQIVFPDTDEAGGDLNRWPSPSDKSGELQAIHRTRHLDVGKDDVNVRARFEYGIVSSAFAASATSKPASPIISAAFIRSRKSSSTTSLERRVGWSRKFAFRTLANIIQVRW